MMHIRRLSAPATVTLLVASTLLVYWAGLTGGFLFDDYPNLVLDADWKVTGFEAAQWLKAVGAGVSSPAGRPLAVLSFALNHALTGLDPFWLKLTGVLIHAFNGLLVWVLCARLFALVSSSGSAATPGVLAAFLIAAAWLIHPLQVSSALYVVQRMELGAATGVLLALLSYVRARRCQLEGRRGWPWLIAAGAAILFGLGFKESAAIAPGFAFLIELLLLRFRRSDGGLSRGWLAAYGFAFIVAVAIYTYIVMSMSASSTHYAVRDFTPGERLLTQFPVLAMYLKQVLLPLPDTLTFYYDNFPVSRGLFSPPMTAWAAALLVAVAGIAAFAWRRWPLAALGIGWFFVAHVLTSNVIPLELAFEHRNYLALLGVLLALVQPLCAFGRRLHADARGVLATLPVLALAGLCVVQAATWGDPMRLAWALESRNPNSPRASYHLGEQFLRLSRGDVTTPAWSLARRQFAHAATLPGGSPLAIQGLIIMDARAARDIDADTWRHFRAKLTERPLHPQSVGALYAVSDCRIAKQCRLSDDELLKTFVAVLTRNPDSATAHTLYANFAWNVLVDHALAIRMQREAVALSPANPQMRVALAKFLLASTQPELVEEGTALADELRDTHHRGVSQSELRQLDALRAATNGSADAERPPSQ